MPVPTSKDLLDYLLAGNHLSPTDLDELIKKQPKEDQYLDYKDGKETKDRKKAGTTIRKYVSGFANSDGGVLIMGVSEASPRAVSPCVGIGKTDLDNWAKDLIIDMVPYFSPQPRFHTVAHSAGDVLVCAVSRAPQLVPCVESRKQKYFFRIGDSTKDAPDFLISDLILGRRNHPVLSLELLEITAEPGQVDERIKSLVHHTFGLGFQFRVNNDSLVPAKEVTVGLVSWAFNTSAPGLNQHLASFVEQGDPPTFCG